MSRGALHGGAAPGCRHFAARDDLAVVGIDELFGSVELGAQGATTLL
jgi:hypothetical protein